ncbi:PorV/PorQ family protein, partial [bacterium]|nr:PorV/PorQ family protein [bacterium]
MKVRSIWVLSCLMLSAARPLLPQEAVGLPFLKIGTGARQAGMGGVFTGISDDVHALYWNPGGLGHIRKWQWAASYTRWFTDIYQANFSMVHQVRGMGSRKVSWGLFASYLGMPEWDATGGKAPAVSAGHLVAGLSFGERLDWLHPSVAFGFTGKAFQSRLADYSATGFAGDAGFLLKPSRFRLGAWGLGLFEYGLFSAGASLLHIGTGMTFDGSNTALPRTWQ